AVDAIFHALDCKFDFVAGKGKNEIVEFQVAARAADDGPLLIVGPERAVEAGGDAVLEAELAREFGGNNVGGVNSRGDLARHPPLHGPERQADAVPADVAYTAVRFEIGLRTDIAFVKFR